MWEWNIISNIATTATDKRNVSNHIPFLYVHFKSDGYVSIPIFLSLFQLKQQSKSFRYDACYIYSLDHFCSSSHYDIERDLKLKSL